MLAKDFQQRNKIYGAEGCFDLPVCDDGTHMITCWELSADDLEIINRTHKIWVRVRERHVSPLWVLTENPFQSPNKIMVSENIADKVFPLFWDDLEIICFLVDEKEYDFKVDEHKMSAGISDYHLTMKHKDFGEQVFTSDYFFTEPLKVLGKVSELYGSFDKLAGMIKKKPTEILIFERVNKTVIE